MSQEPIVGIGMPVYNGAAFLEEALDSILAQTLGDWQLAISDNASTDATEDICRRYAARDDRITYSRNEANIGAHPNYNKTYHAVGGKYFKWVPHDDVLHPEFLAKNVAALEADPGAVVSQSYLDYIDGDGNKIGVYDSALVGSAEDDPVTRFASLILRPHPSYEVMGLYRRSALEGSLLLESFHGADRALLAELALRGRFCQVREPLLIVRDHKDRYTRAQQKPKDRAVWHDARLKGKISLPTWRLYSEYHAMVGRNISQAPTRVRLRWVLVKWWFKNFNAARMLTDLLAVPFPGAVAQAEGIKQRLFAPAPGADEARRHSAS